MVAINRQKRLLKQGLPGNAAFDVGDLDDGDTVRWDADTQKWETIPTRLSIQWNFEEGTVIQAPADTYLRMNAGTLQAVTAFSVDTDNARGDDISTLLSLLRDGDIVTFADSTASKVAIYLVNGTPVDNTTWYQINVTHEVGTGNPAADDLVELLWTPQSGGGGLQATDNAVITGQWTYEARVDIDNASGLRIYDTDDSDYAELNHNGTDLTIGNDGVLITGGGTVLSTVDGIHFHYDSGGDTGYLDIRGTGTYGYGDMFMRCIDLSWFVIGNAQISSIGTWTGGGSTAELTGSTITLDASSVIELEQDTNVTGDLDVTGNITAGNLPQNKFKTAAESVTSSTVLQDDNHLVGFTLDADGWYAVEGYFEVASATGPDFKAQLQFTNAPQDGSWSMTARRSNVSTGAALGDTAATATALMEVIFAATETIGFHVKGFIRANAVTGGTFDLQWAQRTSSATAATIGAGSWLQITKMG